MTDAVDKEKLTTDELVQQLVQEVESQARDAKGPDRYVARALIPLIKSNGLVVEAVKDFQSSTKKTEWVMIILAVAQVVLAFAQLVSAFVLSK